MQGRAAGSDDGHWPATSGGGGQEAAYATEWSYYLGPGRQMTAAGEEEAGDFRGLPWLPLPFEAGGSFGICILGPQLASPGAAI